MLRRVAFLLLLSACGGQGFEPAGDDGMPECSPAGGGPYWVLEGDEVRATIACETGLAIEAGDVEIESAPAGLAIEGTEIVWTPGLDQAAVYDLVVRVPSVDETGLVRIGVVDRWDDPENVPIEDAQRYFEEYGLPVFHLSSESPLGADAYAPTTLVHGGETLSIEAKLRGASSLGYPKHSYTLSFPDGSRFDEPTRGFDGEDKIVLVSTFDDDSYVRQRLAYTLWNALDPGHVPIRAYSAVLYLDGAYHGLYTVTEHVDDEIFEDAGEASGGNVYMAVTHDANFRLDRAESAGPKDDLSEGYEKKDGEPLDDFSDLVALVDFVARSSDADFRDQIDSWIDRRDYEDWWIFVSFVDGQDSAGKNSFHWHDPAGGPFRYLPWDFNASFGQTWQTLRSTADADPDGFVWANRLFERFLAEPTIEGPLRARYREALDGPYDRQAVLDLADEMFAEIHESALRDEAKWGETYRTYDGWSWRDDFLTHEEEADYVRDWIGARWDWLDAAF